MAGAGQEAPTACVSELPAWFPARVIPRLCLPPKPAAREDTALGSALSSTMPRPAAPVPSGSSCRDGYAICVGSATLLRCSVGGQALSSFYGALRMELAQQADAVAVRTILPASVGTSFGEHSRKHTVSMTMTAA